MTAAFDASRSTDPDGEITMYSWVFGDGNTSEGKIVSNTYAKEGEYVVKLTVTDDRGETHSAEHTIVAGKDVGSGDGLKGEYWDGQILQGQPLVSLLAPNIDFRRRGWDGRFITGHVGDKNGDNFSCRWTGLLQPTKSENYTLTLDVNDRGRVWLNGKLVIDAWDKPQISSTLVGRLEPGKKYPIKVEHRKGTFESTGPWKARLWWESHSVAKEIIPATQFYLPERFGRR